MATPDFHGMSDDELEEFVLKQPDSYFVPGALFEYNHRRGTRADKATAKLDQQTTRLVEETVELRRLTGRLYFFTIIVAIFALIQIVIMAFEYCAKLHGSP